MSNASQVGGVADDVFISRAETAAQLAEQASADAAAAQAAAEAARDTTLAALAAQVMNDHADVNAPSPSVGSFLRYIGGNWIDSVAVMADLDNVDDTGITVGQVLAWNDVASEYQPQDVAAISGALRLTGGTLTGSLILDADPVVALEAATKAYVDAQFSTSAPYDIGVFFDGVPSDGDDILRFVSVRDYWLAQDLPTSAAVARVAATAQTDFDIQRNGVSIGTIRWAAAATTATFIFAANVQFNADDTLEIIAPTPADSTLEDLQITLVGRLGVF